MKSNLVADSHFDCCLAVVLSAVMKNENVLTVLSFSLRGQNSRLILNTDSSCRFFFSVPIRNPIKNLQGLWMNSAEIYCQYGLLRRNELGVRRITKRKRGLGPNWIGRRSSHNV